MLYEVMMDDGSSIRVSCLRVDVGMNDGQIITMRVWPPAGGEPYYMRLPEQEEIAFLRCEDAAESAHGSVTA